MVTTYRVLGERPSRTDTHGTRSSRSATTAVAARSVPRPPCCRTHAGSLTSAWSFPARVFPAAAEQTYFARPNVLTRRTSLYVNDKGEMAMRQLVDVVNNDVAVRPGTDALAARVRQGVLDTAAEAASLNAFDKHETTTEIFKQAMEHGAKPVLVQSADDKALEAFKDIFREELPNIPPPERDTEHSIDTGDAKPININAYPLSPVHLEEQSKQIKQILR